MTNSNSKLLAPLLCRAMLVIVVLVLGGCAASGKSLFGVSKRLETADRMTLTGANPLMDSENFEEVNLEMLLDPTNLRKSPIYIPNTKLCGKDATETSEYDERTACLNRAFLAAATTAFYDLSNNLGSSVELRRNRVQDRLLASSEQRCGAYKQYLKAFDIHWETSLGIGTTILGAAGAIATGTLNTRAFSGLAAMLSGARSEVRQGVFSNLASFVIIPGIDLKRSQVLTTIKANRNLKIDEYTVEAAMHDAFTYHNTCTLEAGLEVAQESIKRIENPGLATINRTLATLSETKQLQNMLELANKGALTAEKAKVVKVDYVPADVVLAGSTKQTTAATDKALKNSAKSVLDDYDGMVASVDALQKALMTKVADDKTKPGDKDVLQKVIVELKAYSDVNNPRKLLHTFVTTRTHLQAKTNEIGKTLLEYNRDIDAYEIELLEPTVKDKSKSVVAITISKSTRDAFAKLAFDDLAKEVAAPLLEITKLVSAKTHIPSDVKLLDMPLKTLSTIEALPKPAYEKQSKEVSGKKSSQ